MASPSEQQRENMTDQASSTSTSNNDQNDNNQGKPQATGHVNQASEAPAAQEQNPQMEVDTHQEHQQNQQQEREYESQQQTPINTPSRNIKLRNKENQDYYRMINSGSSLSGHNMQQDPSQVAISADYLAQLIKDNKQLAAFPAVFMHLQRLLDEEITRVRQSLFQLSDVVQMQASLELPEPEGDLLELQEKVYVPVDSHPDYNFVGRILGPRGMTAKQLEQETGCKIKIRGRGSMRDKKKEELYCGKANWEHLSDELHVLISVEDTQNRAHLKIARALEEVKKLLIPIVDGEDELKKRQLIELAIINGTYRNGLGPSGGGPMNPPSTTSSQLLNQQQQQHHQQQQQQQQQQHHHQHHSSIAQHQHPHAHHLHQHHIQQQQQLIHHHHQQQQQQQQQNPMSFLQNNPAPGHMSTGSSTPTSVHSHGHSQHQQLSHLAHLAHHSHHIQQQQQHPILGHEQQQHGQLHNQAMTQQHHRQNPTQTGSGRVSANATSSSQTHHAQAQAAAVAAAAVAAAAAAASQQHHHNLNLSHHHQQQQQHLNAQNSHAHAHAHAHSMVTHSLAPSGGAHTNQAAAAAVAAAALIAAQHHQQGNNNSQQQQQAPGHAHSHQDQVAAAANALLYAQQYHDFQYATQLAAQQQQQLAAVAAASQDYTPSAYSNASAICQSEATSVSNAGASAGASSEQEQQLADLQRGDEPAKQADSGEGDVAVESTGAASHDQANSSSEPSDKSSLEKKAAAAAAAPAGEPESSEQQKPAESTRKQSARVPIVTR